MNAEQTMTDRANWTNEECIRYLEEQGFQVYKCGSIDLMGAFNYHVKQIRELLRENEDKERRLNDYRCKRYYMKECIECGEEGRDYSEYDCDYICDECDRKGWAVGEE